MSLLARGVNALLGPPSPPSTVTTLSLPGQAAPMANYQTFARQGYAGNPIIFAGIDLIATSASEPHIIGRRYRRAKRRTVAAMVSADAWDLSQTLAPAAARSQARAEMKLLQAHGITNRAGRRLLDAMMVRNGFWEELDDHPLVRLLNNPNPFMSRGQLWGTVTMDYHLAGNAYVYKARYTSGMLQGAVGELWRLRPDRVRVVAGNMAAGESFIKGYEYGAGRDKIFLPADDVMHFKTRNPLDDFYGMPPLMSVLGRMSIDRYMERFLSSFYEGGGVGPGAILSVKGAMEQSDKDAVRDRHRRQFGTGGTLLDLMILDNAEDVTYQQLGLARGLRDALPKEIDAVTEARLAMVLGLPGSILGLLIGYESSSYANKRQDWQVLWDVKMTPMLSDFDDVLNLSMTPEFGGIDEVMFDTSDIRALQEDEDALQDRARKNFISGGLGLGEFRLKIGEDPELPVDDVFYIPSNMVPTKADDIGEAPDPANPTAEPAQLVARAFALIEARVGRPRIEEDEGARGVYNEAMRLRGEYPSMTWDQIAGRVGVVERTLRKYRSTFDDE